MNLLFIFLKNTFLCFKNMFYRLNNLNNDL